MTWFKRLVVAAVIAASAQLSMAEEAYEVTAKAWAAMGEKKWDEVVKLADQSYEIWGEQAKAKNDSLKDYPGDDDVKSFANLNEVGTILWIKGEALRKKGDKKGALEAYQLLLKDFKYAQCWDPQGWWWKPAVAAQGKIAELKD